MGEALPLEATVTVDKKYRKSLSPSTVTRSSAGFHWLSTWTHFFVM